MQHVTKTPSVKDIKRSWHLVDVKGMILGRVATDIAHKLMGKSKPYFVRNIDCGDYVVVINSDDVDVTGKKEDQKMYGNYSGYPGGFKQKAFWQVRDEKSTEIIRRAVMGMLPKNKLRDRLMTRLYIYKTNEHPYEDKFK